MTLSNILINLRAFAIAHKRWQARKLKVIICKKYSRLAIFFLAVKKYYVKLST